MKNNGRLRLSYSLLDIFSKGDIDRAVSLYLHLNKKGTVAMEEGKTYHEKWSKEIKKNNELKLGASTFTFKEPLSEHVIEIPYNDRWDIKAVIDCLDGDILYEFKTGTAESLEYARGYQIPFYFLVCELAGINVERALILHWNQHIKKEDFVIVYNSQELKDKAKNFIDSLAPELEQFFVEQGIILPIEN